jgi:hypothetical protein
MYCILPDGVLDVVLLGLAVPFWVELMHLYCCFSQLLRVKAFVDLAEPAPS